jgi:hypothetical protein
VKSGKVLWTDNSPGANVLHGQWSSPAFGVFDGVAQVLFGAGDGYLYSFAAEGKDGNAEMLWKFDCNPKESIYLLGGRATRNHLIATPVVYDGLVYIGVGEDPEHGEGQGHLWCIDPKKRGDVSPTLSLIPKTPRNRLLISDFRRWMTKPVTLNVRTQTQLLSGITREQTHPSLKAQCTEPAVPWPLRMTLLFVADFSGLFHCLNAKTGEPHWTYDMFAASWASPLIVEDRVYIGDEDGDIAIFKLSAEMEKLLAKKSTWAHLSTRHLSLPTTPCSSPIATASTPSRKVRRAKILEERACAAARIAWQRYFIIFRAKEARIFRLRRLAEVVWLRRGARCAVS